MAKGRSRDQRKESFWRSMVRGHAGSGLTVQAWCRKHGQRVSAFYWWRAELARRVATCDEAGRAEHPAFVPVRVTQDLVQEPGTLMEIVLSHGQRIRLSGRVDRQMLSDVVAVLTGSVAPADGSAAQTRSGGRAC